VVNGGSAKDMEAVSSATPSTVVFFALHVA